MDAASGYKNGSRPTPGDLSVCAYCGEFLIFTEALTIRKMELGEELALPEENRQQLQEVRRAVQLKNRLSGREG